MYCIKHKSLFYLFVNIKKILQEIKSKKKTTEVLSKTFVGELYRKSIN